MMAPRWQKLLGGALGAWPDRRGPPRRPGTSATRSTATRATRGDEPRASLGRAPPRCGRAAPRPPRACARPGSASSRSSIAATDWTSRVVEARKASSARQQLVRRAGALLDVDQLASRRSRVIEARMCSSSGGVHSAPSASTQKIDDVGASSTRPCGVTSSASSKPRSCASRVAEHVAGVGERLDAVEHARRRVGDEAEPRPLGRAGSGSVSSRRRPPRVSTIRRQPSKSPPPRASSSSAHLALELRARHVVGQAQVGGRALEPVEVLVERERPPVVDADDLEHAVAAQQALVGGGDRSLARRARCGRRGRRARRSAWRRRRPCPDLLRRPHSPRAAASLRVAPCPPRAGTCRETCCRSSRPCDSRTSRGAWPSRTSEPSS